MKKGVKFGVCLLLCGMLLTGCGQAKVPEEISVTSISISKEGEVTSYLVGAFDKNYYDISELTSMAVEEAAAYNTLHLQGNGTPVTVEKVAYAVPGDGSVPAEGGNIVVLQEKYSSAEVYADYNGKLFFFGTVAQAQAAGYALDFILASVKDGTLLPAGQLLQKQEQHILIADVNAVFYCPYKVTHVSNGAVYEKDGSVNALGTEGTVAILMK